MHQSKVKLIHNVSEDYFDKRIVFYAIIKVFNQNHGAVMGENYLEMLQTYLVLYSTLALLDNNEIVSAKVRITWIMFC